jgi:hypothetical protein
MTPDEDETAWSDIHSPGEIALAEPADAYPAQRYPVARGGEEGDRKVEDCLVI